MSEQQSLLLQYLADLGEMRAGLGTLQAQCTAILVEQQRASEGRRETYQKLAELEQSAVLMKQTLDRIVPLVEDHEIKHQRGLGMAWLIRVVYAAGGGAVIAAIAKVLGIKIGG